MKNVKYLVALMLVLMAVSSFAQSDPDSIENGPSTETSETNSGSDTSGTDGDTEADTSNDHSGDWTDGTI